MALNRRTLTIHFDDLLNEAPADGTAFEIAAVVGPDTTSGDYIVGATLADGTLDHTGSATANLPASPTGTWYVLLIAGFGGWQFEMPDTDATLGPLVRRFVPPDELPGAFTADDLVAGAHITITVDPTNPNRRIISASGDVSATDQVARDAAAAAQTTANENRTALAAARTVPTGGTASQVLTAGEGNRYAWADPTGGSGGAGVDQTARNAAADARRVAGDAQSIARANRDALPAIRTDVADLERKTTDLKVTAHDDWANVVSDRTGAFELDTLNVDQPGYRDSVWEVSHTANRYGGSSPLFTLSMRIPLADDPADFRLIDQNGQVWDHDELSWSEGAPDATFRYFTNLGNIELAQGDVLRIQKSTRSYQTIYEGDVPTPTRDEAPATKAYADAAGGETAALAKHNAQLLSDVREVQATAWQPATATQAQWNVFPDFDMQPDIDQLVGLAEWQVSGTKAVNGQVVIRVGADLHTGDLHNLRYEAAPTGALIRLDAAIWEDVAERGGYVYLRLRLGELFNLRYKSGTQASIRYQGVNYSTAFSGILEGNALTAQQIAERNRLYLSDMKLIADPGWRAIAGNEGGVALGTAGGATLNNAAQAAALTYRSERRGALGQRVYVRLSRTVAQDRHKVRIVEPNGRTLGLEAPAWSGFASDANWFYYRTSYVIADAGTIPPGTLRLEYLGAAPTVYTEYDGTVPETPTADNHPASKKYVDDNAGGSPRSRVIQAAVAAADGAGVRSITLPSNYATYRDLNLGMWDSGADHIVDHDISTALLAAQTQNRNILVGGGVTGRAAGITVAWNPTARTITAQQSGDTIILAELHD